MALKVDIRKKIGNFSLDVRIETSDPITGLLGASGCGKSMTLKCISGIEVPDSGHIEIDGRILFDSDRKINIKPQNRDVGYLFQNYALFPTMNVRRNIMCGLQGIKDKSERSARYHEVVSLMHLEGLENHRPYQLSGGQAQRTALARMLASNPSILLLDEPFSALDSFLRKELQRELSELLSKIGKQVILVTHSQKEVRRMSSRLFVMKNGSIIRSGSTEEVFEEPGSKECAVLLEE